MAAKLTHINYAFGNVSADGRCFEVNLAGQGDAFADYQKTFDAATSVGGVADTCSQPLNGNFNQLASSRRSTRTSRVLISLGGWTYSKYFSDAALTAASRQALRLLLHRHVHQGQPAVGRATRPAARAPRPASSTASTSTGSGRAREGNVGNVIRPQDKQNFTLLLAEFRRQLDAYGATVGKHYSLSAFLPADPAKIDAGLRGAADLQLAGLRHRAGLRLPRRVGDADHAPGQPVPGGRTIPSPVKFSGDLAISTYTSAGAPAAKLLLGLPYYGRGWTGVGRPTTGCSRPAPRPPGTWEAGIEDYKVLKNRPGTGFRDTAAGALWLYDGTNFGPTTTRTVIAQKTAYVKQKGLGGVMVWELDGDDGTLTTAVDTGLR